MGKNSVCHPAYQVVATISVSPGFELLPPFEAPPEVVVVAVAAGAEALALAIAEEGTKEHMGAAHAEAKLRARRVRGNMCNMLEV
jgi:hypothetical protein